MIELPDGTTIMNFDKREFDCKCGCGNGIEEMDLDFLATLDYARDEANVPFIVTSGYRCVKHNKDAGGKDSSAHLKGLAADIHAPTARRMFAIVDGLLSAGVTRIGIGKDFVHADEDPDKNERRMWPYGK